MSRLARLLLSFAAVLWLVGLTSHAQAQAQDLPEYRLKAAFLYNFALFTEWPAEVGSTLNLCVIGADPFGDELEGLNGKAVGNRSLAVQRRPAGQLPAGCHVVFIPAAAMPNASKILEQLKGQPALTVADSPGAAGKGIALNMKLVNNRVAFEANPRAARSAGLTLSARLLRLATEIIE